MYLLLSTTASVGCLEMTDTGSLKAGMSIDRGRCDAVTTNVGQADGVNPDMWQIDETRPT
jgi:hypothetical protein